ARRHDPHHRRSRAAGPRLAARVRVLRPEPEEGTMTALPVAATVAGAAFVLAAPVVQDVEGVQVPGSITAADRTLTLNFSVWLGEDPVDSDLKDKMLDR